MRSAESSSVHAELLSQAPQLAGITGVDRAINIIRHTVHAQSQIIDDLLDLSRLPAGELRANALDAGLR